MYLAVGRNSGIVMPSAADVRQAVTFGWDGNRTGTLGVPATPPLFDDQQTQSMVQMINDRGVLIIYRPAIGAARTIKAIVRQEPPTKLATMPKASSTFTTILVLNDSTAGISSTELDTGGDKVDIQTRFKVAATTRPIKSLITHNPSIMKLRIR